MYFPRVDPEGDLSIFGQIFLSAVDNDRIDYHSKDGRWWEVHFQGEFSVDYGGPFRDALNDMVDELAHDPPLLPLFIPVPNKRVRLCVAAVDTFVNAYVRFS